MSGALLTAWECFCTIISFVAFAWLKSQLAGHLEKQNQNFATFFEEKIRSPVKILLMITICSIVLCIATIIQGAVILGQILNRTEMYFYMGVVSFLYTGLGAGSMVLGFVGLCITSFLLKRLLDFHRSSSASGIFSSAEAAPIDQSVGSVEQLNVTDLTYYAQDIAESSLPQSPISFQSQYADTRSILSQGSDQAFFDSTIFSAEKFQPVKTIYAARIRTGSSTVTDI
jgi:hypothetical protein